MLQLAVHIKITTGLEVFRQLLKKWIHSLFQIFAVF